MMNVSHLVLLLAMFVLCEGAHASQRQLAAAPIKNRVSQAPSNAEIMTAVRRSILGAAAYRRKLVNKSVFDSGGKDAATTSQAANVTLANVDECQTADCGNYVYGDYIPSGNPMSFGGGLISDPMMEHEEFWVTVTSQYYDIYQDFLLAPHDPRSPRRIDWCQVNSFNKCRDEATKSAEYAELICDLAGLAIATINKAPVTGEVASAACKFGIKKWRDQVTPDRCFADYVECVNMP